MNLNRKTALTTDVKHITQGGSYYDSFTFADMFNYKPHDMGHVASQIFSSKIMDEQVNKKWVFMTLAQKNCYELPPGTDDYKWRIPAESDIQWRITELVMPPDSKPGKKNTPFKFVANKPFLHEPAIVKIKGFDIMIKILGHPIQKSAASWEYEAELQTGNPAAYIPINFLTSGNTFVRTSSSVSTELNTKYASIDFGGYVALQSWVGSFANKVEFTDKFIRLEKANLKKMNASVTNSGVVKGLGEITNPCVDGYLIQNRFAQETKNTGPGDVVQRGMFIAKAEARIMERTFADVESNFEFGQLQQTIDRDSGRPIKVAAGWRSIVKDGHYFVHNGNLTIEELSERLNLIFLNKVSFNSRKVMFSTGTGGFTWLHNELTRKFGSTQAYGDLMVKQTTSQYSSNALQAGGQFVKFIDLMGLEIGLIYDPTKDNTEFDVIPDGEVLPASSYTLDIYDLDKSDATPQDAVNSSNITCLKEGLVDEFYTVHNIYDWTGPENLGRNVWSNNKELGIYHAVSGGLCAWDVSRVATFEYDPRS